MLGQPFESRDLASVEWRSPQMVEVARHPQIVEVARYPQYFGNAFGHPSAVASLKAQDYRKVFGGPEQVLKLLQGAGPCLWSWKMTT